MLLVTICIYDNYFVAPGGPLQAPRAGRRQRHQELPINNSY